MTAVGMIGVFVLLCGALLYRHAGTQPQHDISSAFVGIGGGLLVVYLIGEAMTR